MKIGYAQGELEGDWAVFAKIAGFFVYKVPPEDREDFLHDLMLEMDKVKAKYEVKGKPLTEASLMVVARYELLGYWDKRRLRLYGLNCTRCTIEQRRECHTTKMPSECPKGKAVRLLSLDTPGENGDGNKLTKLNELIADNKSIDLAARLDARRTLQRLPKRIVKIGYKVYAGIPIEKEEKRYLKEWQKAYHMPLGWKRDHLDERILKLLRKNPKGLTRADLSMRLQVYVREVQRYLIQLSKKKQVIAVNRQSTRGRSPTPLFFIAGATIPEEKNVKEERDERIRQAYFLEGWSIKRIKRELHHDKRTIRRALNRNEFIPWLTR